MNSNNSQHQHQQSANKFTQLKLQPIFVNDHDNSNNVKMELRPRLSQISDEQAPQNGSTSDLQSNQPMTSEDFWNMWNVATKAKSSINQGRRLENLSWRLWHHHTTRQLDPEQKPGEAKATLDANLAVTCASILNEIQRASCVDDHHVLSRSLVSDEGRASSHEEVKTPPASPNTTMQMDQNGNDCINMHNQPATSTNNNPASSTSTTNEYLMRKKKKNVERYMKRHQRRLAGIIENCSNPSMPDTVQQSVEVGTNPVPIKKESPVDDLFKKRSFEDQLQPLHNGTSSPKSVVSERSLLSRLLMNAKSPPHAATVCSFPHAPIPRPCPNCFSDSLLTDDDCLVGLGGQAMNNNDIFMDCVED